MIEFICDFCGNIFLAYPNRAKANTVCCGRECAAKLRLAEKESKCATCGKMFHKKKSRIEKSKESFCSVACFAEAKKQSFCGKGNHQFGLKGDLNDSHLSDFSMSRHGYVLVLAPNHPKKNYNGKVFFHRMIEEEKNRRAGGSFYLPDGIEVHHKNEIKTDNRPCNLVRLSKSEHISLHNRLIKRERDEKGMFIKYSKLPSAKVPSRAHKFDAGMDLFSTEKISIAPGSSAIVPTGIFMEIPEEHVGLIWSKSGLSVKNKIEIGAGCIDSTYRGEILVHAYNLGDSEFVVDVGNKIAQILIMPIALPELIECEDLQKTERGAGGFGSSGIK